MSLLLRYAFGGKSCSQRRCTFSCNHTLISD